MSDLDTMGYLETIAELKRKLALLRAVAEAAEGVCDEHGTLVYVGRVQLIRLHAALKAAKDGGALCWREHGNDVCRVATEI